MGFDKGLHRVAAKRSSLAFESSGFIIAAPSTLAERRLVKRAESTRMMYRDMAEEFEHRAAMLRPGSSSHRASLLAEIGDEYRRDARTVEKALAIRKATLLSS